MICDSFLVLIGYNFVDYKIWFLVKELEANYGLLKVHVFSGGFSISDHFWILSDSRHVWTRVGVFWTCLDTCGHVFNFFEQAKQLNFFSCMFFSPTPGEEKQKKEKTFLNQIR